MIKGQTGWKRRNT